MSRGFPWNRLGIEATSDTAAIRKAYADALRATNVDEDIAGYAELRRARDQALWLAAQAARAAEAGEGEGDLGFGDEADWDDDDDYDEWDGDQWAWDDSPGARHPDPLGGDSAPELTESQRRAQEAWQALLRVLYPDGAPSDAAVTFDELDAGRAALEVLVARAQDADLAEHDALEGALADVFTRTWPRSAPFVETATAAFGWLDEDGALEERPALRFLNQRVKGMRFHEKVQRREHPLHRAWTELSRPGRARFRDRLLVNRLEIHKLITGIRERYPELESHLDPERVASWEGRKPDGTPSGLGPRFVRWVVIALVIGLALTRLISALDDGPGGGPTVSQAEVAAALKTAEINIAVMDIFGKGNSLTTLRTQDPALATELEQAGRSTDQPGPLLLALVRLKALAAAEAADRASLLVRTDLRSLWLTAARRQSDAVCRKVLEGGFVGLDLSLTDKERERERALLRQLRDARLLGLKPEGGEYRYSIPGWLVEATLKRSGLSPERLRAALTTADDKDRCAAETALVEAVRAAPGRVPEEVLKGL